MYPGRNPRTACPWPSGRSTTSSWLSRREALVQLRLQAIVHRAITDVAVIYTRPLPIRRKERLTGRASAERLRGVHGEDGRLVDAMISDVGNLPRQIKRERTLHGDVPGF